MCEDGQTAIQCVRSWQTLISALIALIAAAITIFFIWRQITDERQRHKDALHRKSLAARAQMPDALHAICAYTDGCMRFLDGRADEPPTPPTEAANVLKNAIEYIHPEAAQSVFELISHYQVHNARLHSWRTEKRLPVERNDRIYDTALLRQYTNRLFEYARNETDVATTQEPPRDKMMTALTNSIGLVHYVTHEKTYKPVVEIIERDHD